MEEPLILKLDSGAQFPMVSLTEDRLDEAIALCDECVGQNMYPRAYLRDVITRPGHYFYLVLSPQGEAIAYTYFFLSDLDEMAAFAKVSRAYLAQSFHLEDPVIGDIRSIGVRPDYRFQGISLQLTRFTMDAMRSLSADVAFGVYWRPNGVIPMARVIEATGLIPLCETHMVWYDDPDLYCPVCKGRCRCDAVLHYKPLKEAEQS